MSSPSLPTGITKLLAAFEKRLLSLLLLFGLGRLLVMCSALLVLLYGLDRLFQPPTWFRLALLALALFYLARISLESLLRPLRHRPRKADLAALLERSNPQLSDLLATAVEVDQVHPSESEEFKAAVAERAALAVAQIDLQEAAPSGAARRSALRGLGLSTAILALCAMAPSEAKIFLHRLIGGNTAWPQDTQLLILPPYSATSGQSLDLIPIGDQSYELHVARGTTVNLRVRAEGEIPEQVFAQGTLGRRAMQALGGGEFVLRLPSVDVASSWSFIGGDDQDGTPHLNLIPGNPPAIIDWIVSVQPPEYTGLKIADSNSHEFRIPQDSRISVSFAADLPVKTAWIRQLDGTRTPLPAGANGWQTEVVAEQSGELAFELEGTDGFLNRRAGTLRWNAEPDHKPRVHFLFPDRRWTALVGASIPLLLNASDDFGLANIELAVSDQLESWEPELEPGAMEWQHFQLFTAPMPSAENFGADFRMRIDAKASDASQPVQQQSEAHTPWIQVLSPASYERDLAERMVRVRERVEDQLARLQPVLDGGEQQLPITSIARRVDRELEGLLRDLEYALMERVYSGLDRGAAGLQPPLNNLLASGSPAPGEILSALSESGVPPVLDRSALLMTLAQTALSTRIGPSQAFRQASGNPENARIAAQEVKIGLQTMLEALLAWEDYQSAVDLLRGLLDRQRNLYLRTLEASGR